MRGTQADANIKGDGALAQRPSKVRRVSSKDRREQYFKVAGELAIKQGVDAVTMEAVAAGVGVNKALLYRQFSNRGELLLALHQRTVSELDRRIVAAIQSERTLEDKVRAWIHEWFDYMSDYGLLLRRMMEAPTVAREVERPARSRQQKVNQRNGDWYSAELGLPIDVGRDAAAIIYFSLGGVIERWTEAPTGATRRRLENTLCEMVLGGLKRLSTSQASNTGAREHGE